MARRVSRADVPAMIDQAAQVARDTGRTTYLQPTAYGLALLTSRTRVVGCQYIEVGPDGTVTQHSLDGAQVIGQVTR